MVVPARLDLSPDAVANDGTTIDLSIYQGDDYSLPLRVPINGSYTSLVGYTGSAQIRQSGQLGTSGSVLVSFTFTLGDQTTTPGSVTLSLSNASTGALPFTSPAPLDAADSSNYYYWDLQMTGGGETHTYLAGLVNVYEDVTE